MVIKGESLHAMLLHLCYRLLDYEFLSPTFIRLGIYIEASHSAIADFQSVPRLRTQCIDYNTIFKNVNLFAILGKFD